MPEDQLFSRDKIWTTPVAYSMDRGSLAGNTGPTVVDYSNGRALAGKSLSCRTAPTVHLVHAQPGCAYTTAGDLCRFDLRALRFRECIGRSNKHVKGNRLLFQA